MIRLRDIMTRDVVAVSPDVSLRKVIELLSARGISGMPVVRGDRAVGMITAKDIIDFEVAVRAAAEAYPDAHLGAEDRDALADHPVSEIMTRAVMALPSSATVEEAADYLHAAKVHRLLVVDDGKMVGIVTTMDIATAVAEHKLGARTYVFERPASARRSPPPAI